MGLIRRVGKPAFVAILAVAVMAPLHVARADHDPLVSVIGSSARLISPGHYEMTLADGTVYHTHGGDPVEDHGTNIGPGDPERDPVCATDYYMHVLYGYRQGSTNRYSSVVNQIRSSIKRINAVLNESGVLSGGKTADYKVRCDANGDIAVGQFSASTNSSATFEQISNGANSAGFNDPKVDYLIYWDGSYSGVCGIATLWLDDRASGTQNYNNGNSGQATYGVAYQPCWDNRTPMHENGHNQGAVQSNAPQSTGNGHCNDTYDVMCYAPDGGTKNQTEWLRCTDRMHFDCAYDTYFHTNPPGSSWLATKWNLGSTQNRYISFDAVPTNKPPIANFTSSCSNLTCTFTDSSSDPDGTIAARLWSFGDGQTSTATNPSHTYSSGGSYTVSLTVTDDGGATGVKSTIIQIGPPPAPTITSPAEGSTVYNPPFSISGTAQASSLVRIYESGSVISSTTASISGAWSVSVNMAEGSHTITATAENADGEGPASAPRSFTVAIDTSIPDPPVITNPTGGFVASTVQVGGTAPTGTTVRVYSNGILRGTTSAPSGTFAVTITLPSGQNTLTATAQASNGKVSGSSNQVVVTVDTQSPTVNLHQFNNQIFLLGNRVIASGDANDNDDIARVTVQFYNTMNTLVATVDAVLGPRQDGGIREWEADPGPLFSGRYRIVATAYDRVGLTSADSRFVYRVGI